MKQTKEQRKQPNCNKCGRELTIYFSEDFAGSNEGTCGFKCDWCDSRTQAISEFKEKLKENLHNEFGVFDDGATIIEIIEKTAQEIK